MWVQTYDFHQHSMAWPRLLAVLEADSPASWQPALRAQLIQLLTEELARDPEEEMVLAASQLIDAAERSIRSALPWYGGVLRFSNTCLTGWTPQAHFLVQAQDRVPASVDALLAATAILPGFVHTLERTFEPVRASIYAHTVPVAEVEQVLDLIIQTTQCRMGWSHTLFAALQWMHEACRVPLPEARRQAMASWIDQSCLPGMAPPAILRAEILAAMAQSLRRGIR